MSKSKKNAKSSTIDDRGFDINEKYHFFSNELPLQFLYLCRKSNTMSLKEYLKSKVFAVQVLVALLIILVIGYLFMPQMLNIKMDALPIFHILIKLI